VFEMVASFQKLTQTTFSDILFLPVPFLTTISDIIVKREKVLLEQLEKITEQRKSSSKEVNRLTALGL